MKNDLSKPKVGIFGLTGCAGDQLQILNCEDRLLELVRDLDIVDWVMVRSENDHGCELDFAFVEGVVATARDLESLREVRKRADNLVAIGTCAVWGGLPAMRNSLPRDVTRGKTDTALDLATEVAEARPATDFVDFEFQLPGCPIERHEFLALVRAILAGTTPELPAVPVCWECKTRELACRVITYGEICCGAMTRAGCGARCPGHGVACAGCRGPVEEPHYDANVLMFADRGLSWKDIAARMRVFSAPVWMTLGLEQEAGERRDD
jgi:coenzyme F420-reducing hydrogenase gamma subunit